MTGPGGTRGPVGRRGGALLILAAADLGYGLALLAGYTPATDATSIAPPSTWGTIWIVAAVLLGLGAFAPADGPAYAAAALLKFGWAALLIAGAATGHHHQDGYWGPAIPWLALAGLTLLIAGWPEERR